MSSNASRVDAIRRTLIQRIWSGAGVPTAGATSVATGQTDPLTVSASNLGSVDILTIECRDNSSNLLDTNSPTVWRPSTGSNSKLVLFMTGHTGSFNLAGSGYGDIINALIDAGYTVCGVHMAYADPSSSATTVATHNALPTPNSTLNHLRVFMEPAIRAVNELIGEGFTHVFQTGLSGGGWAAPLLGALDTRISRLAPVAGSQPLFVTESSRDWEQFLPGIDDVVDYSDLYVMAASGGRRFLHCLNNTDSCCFFFTNYMTSPYGGAVAAKADEYGGTFAVRWDNTHSNHTISSATRTAILSFFSA